MDSNIQRRREQRNTYMRRYRLAHIDQERARDKRRRQNPKRKKWRKAWDAKHREQARIRAKNWYHKNKDRAYIAVRANKLKKQYGITIEQYDEMYKKQRGRCAICKRHYRTFIMGLAVDHDHKTGQIRGLLCGICNTYLARIKDDPTSLVAYLKLEYAP